MAAESATIRQRILSDCWLCCLAMATGRSDEQTVEVLGPKTQAEGADTPKERRALAVIGYRPDEDDRSLSMHPEWATTGFVRNILCGRRAVLSVRIKNKNAGERAVYWDGTELHDPSQGRLYRWDEVEPTTLILFNERSGPWKP